MDLYSRRKQLAALLEIEADIKLAKAAWLRDDHHSMAVALDRATEHLATMPEAEAEYALAVPSDGEIEK